VYICLLIYVVEDNYCFTFELWVVIVIIELLYVIFILVFICPTSISKGYNYVFVLSQTFLNLTKYIKKILLTFMTYKNTMKKYY
jgi:hypothetical protein